MDGIYVGLMSGTSLDAIDTVAIRIEGQSVSLLAADNVEISTELKQTILSLCAPGPNEIHRAMSADRALGQQFADATLSLLAGADIAPEDVIAIGSHGQTIRHQPTGDEAYSLQIGDPNTIAEMTGILTVADFRRRDIAAGGQGAPLIPLFHKALLLDKHPNAIALNLGGMANITAMEASGRITGYDTGPGNVLIDFWAAQHLGQHFDANGDWAKQGFIVPALLETLLQDPYFSRPHPKSTGREHFNRAWLEQHLAAWNSSAPLKPQDVQATLTELTARSVVNELRHFPETKQVFCCGGGAHNGFLLSRLQQAASLSHPGCEILPSDAAGLPADWVEAMGFAWFAYRTLRGEPTSLAQVTGAGHDSVSGGIFPGKRGVRFIYQKTGDRA